jgi:NADP-dependent alcohol dehydrogenase
MKNFTYFNPTKIIFGEHVIAKIADEISEDHRIMITYGGGSVKKNGVYNQVISALKGRKIIEFGGIEPNPQYSTLMKAIDICRNDQVTFLLAVGGGSVLDGTKFIAAAVPFRGEPWDILEKGAKVKTALPFGAVLTLPATGSEMNPFAVISRKETGQKLAFGASPHTNPEFSVLDPAITRTLPKRQRGNGVVDAFVHVTEQYLTYPQQAQVQDRYAEAILKTLIENGHSYLNDLDDMDAAKNIMWAATMALNGLLACGVATDWATHRIGHEFTALYGIDHARTLAVIWPGMMRVMAADKGEKLLQFAERVWNIDEGSEQERIEKAIAKTEHFFNSMGVPTKLTDYDLDAGAVEEVVKNLRKNGQTELGEHKSVTPEKVHEILSTRL